MDEGIAALIAGVTGMVGALGGAIAGGLAAVKGARIGAEKTAESTRQQVQDQAAVEHSHWLREQRKDAYISFIAATHATSEAAKSVTTMENMQLLEFNESVNELIKTSSTIKLMGPEVMIEVAGGVIGAALEFRRAMWEESRIEISETQNALDASERTDEAADNFHEMENNFVKVAQGVIGNMIQ